MLQIIHNYRIVNCIHPSKVLLEFMIKNTDLHEKLVDAFIEL